MRSTLFAVGAFLFLSYPLVLLFAVARNIDEPGKNPDTAAITLTPRSAKHMMQRDGAKSSYGELRNTTLRRAGH
jgi:hypothetical protein